MTSSLANGAKHAFQDTAPGLLRRGISGEALIVEPGEKTGRSPVWQIGPAGSAFTRIVSRSQSTNRSFTRRKCPDVSTFLP